MMQSPVPAGQPTSSAHVPNAAALASETVAFADRAYAAVSEAYLGFRRHFYHEANPSLATEPPPITEIQQGEPGRIAGGALKVLPKAARAIPLVQDLADHLKRVEDIHTLTEEERTTLHNLSMVYLYGLRGGIQAWYVEYMLDSAHRLTHISDFDYYIKFPWHALFYLNEAQLAAFDSAVRTGNTPEIQQHIEHLGNRLINALNNPYEAQDQLAFSGPNGDRHRIVFNLKTTAALAVGAYLAVEAVRTFMGPHETPPPPKAVIDLIPQQMSQHLIERPQTTGEQA